MCAHKRISSMYSFVDTRWQFFQIISSSAHWENPATTPPPSDDSDNSVVCFGNRINFQCSQMSFSVASHRWHCSVHGDDAAMFIHFGLHDVCFPQINLDFCFVFFSSSFRLVIFEWVFGSQSPFTHIACASSHECEILTNSRVSFPYQTDIQFVFSLLWHSIIRWFRCARRSVNRRNLFSQKKWKRGM